MLSQETSRRTSIESFIDIEEDAANEYLDDSHKEMCLEVQANRRRWVTIWTAMDRK
jgi:hypothetical protein